MLQKCRAFVLAAIIVSVAVEPARAQTRATTADLSGVVMDASHSVVQSATVRAINSATGLERSATTDNSGRYLLPALPPGRYGVQVSMPGFETQIAENVLLALGEAAELNFTLQVAATEEAVTVVAGASLVDTRRTAIAGVVSLQQIDSLPINGRNFISFSIITPGVTTDRTPQQGASATSGLTFAGQRARSNNITVDGVDNTDPVVGAVRATPSQEAVREFQVLANAYSAEFGKASGGVVNIVTRSGTNTPSGNAFYFFRDEALNARAHFEVFDPAGARIDRDKAPFRQHQFGGTFGGPIRRSRSFFFTSAERLDIQASNFVNIDNATPITVFGENHGTVVDVLRRAGFPVEAGNVPYYVESTNLLGKVDASLTPRHGLAARLHWVDVLDENVEAWGGQIARSRGAFLDSSDFALAISLTSLVSSRSVNELRVQVANRRQRVVSLDPQSGPTLEIGAIGVGRHRFTPQPRENRRYQVVESVSHQRGRHHLKAGVDFSFIQHGSLGLPLHFGGRYIFAPLPAIPALGVTAPITAIEALALGLPAAYVQGYGNPEVRFGYSDMSLFVQDEWQALDTLTLKLGLRYQNQFWKETSRTVAGLAPYGWPADNDNLAPRLGLAWAPRTDRRTSVHGSYGIFFDNHITGLWGTTEIVSGTSEHVRTLAAGIPLAILAWQSPGRRLPEPAVGYPSLVLSIDPGLRTPYAHHAAAGIEREIFGRMALAADVIYARGFDQTGTIDYNPVTDPATGNRPLDRDGIAGTSSPVLQYTSWGETWYRGVALSLRKRFSDRHHFHASYTLSRAEDTSADFQSFFIPQHNGRGRDPRRPHGLPLGFDPRAERGPSLQDQRHRFVLTGGLHLPAQFSVSTLVTLASGRPYNILAGADLNGDGNGGATAPDRPRRDPADESTAIRRNAGTLPAHYSADLRIAKRVAMGPRARLDLMVELFNLLNRTNYTNVDNIFGRGAYPAQPLPTFGQRTEAAPPFQAQVAAKIAF